MSTWRTLMAVRIGDHARWRLKPSYVRTMSKAALRLRPDDCGCLASASVPASTTRWTGRRPSRAPSRRRSAGRYRYPAAHAEVDAQVGSFLRRLEPHRLAPPVRRGEHPPDQRVAHLTREVRPAHEGVVVVHVHDPAVQRRVGDQAAGVLDL